MTVAKFLLCLLCIVGLILPASADRLDADNRIRTVEYSADEIYRLRGYVGYEIDLQFEPGEAFVGLGAGDVEGLTYAAQDNHLFVKPKAQRVRTDLTVLTTRRSYHFDYEVLSAAGPRNDAGDLIYTLRFAYPAPAPVRNALAEANPDEELDGAAANAAVNRDYWYCGNDALRPLSAFDDGVHTVLHFNPRGELPAFFVRNEDGSESLLNFNVREGEVIIHRVARQLVVRRGKLAGCILNKSFGGIGQELRSGTVSSKVERATRGQGP
ncbi:MAG TPA: TrbG/VirB9 family P-type conjugative transfer protein [Steroidobacteraceae bacterium]